MENILDKANENQSGIVELRRWFHRHPESSTKEYRTAEKIRKELDRLTIPYGRAGETGTVAVITGVGNGPVIAIRADIDALEITEHTKLEFVSENPGIMHACGHDAHTAGLLGAAEILWNHRHELNGTVKLIFQPAEEIGRGADVIIDSGLVDDVKAFFGIHVDPTLDVGTVALSPHSVCAGANSLKIHLLGKSAHAARPDAAIDTIAAGAEIVEALQHFVSRELDPTKLAVISVCRFNAGTRDNIIAGEAHLSGTVRAVEDDVREQASEAVKRITTHIAAAHRVRAEVECDYATPIVYNDPELYKTALKAAQKLASEDKTGWIKVVPQPIVMGTEDFGRYSTVAPSFYAKVGSGKGPQLHSDYFLLDERALITLSALHVLFVNELLESAEKVRQ